MTDILVIYSIFDSKAEAYHSPIHATNDAVATRMFSNAVNDESHEFNRHSEDYVLFRVGTFDQASGLVVSELGVPIAKAHEIKVTKP